ncbi:UDP-N-acetylmuramate dehydrogenase [Agrococcus jejuensis]|uniref:UDP-N-acetylmuramate dehydrogenase n=1 Tax=Agrococcus jejuensis TaxID=399736 RepID=UPI0011A747C5|nr:UDP-N-acetylmuramate dehydrogenase [Agrococcus jejuensis]
MRFADATTMRVGGEADRWVDASTREEAVEAYLALIADDEPHVLLGGGSNTVASDEPFEGTVLRMRTSGVEVLPAAARRERPAGDEEPDDASIVVRVEAGESWEALVERTVAEGWAGIEALSGIPGSVGAAPIQNIGAYGQELGACLVGIDLLDADSREVRHVPASQLRLGYRDSALKRGDLQGLVLSVDLRLRRSADALSQPIAYGQLAQALGVDLGRRVPLDAVRETVLALRSSKGMVLSDDPDSVSAGSFFTNPIVSGRFAAQLPEDAPRWSTTPEATATIVPLDADTRIPVREPVESRVKLSAAWLIERAGIRKGYALPHSRAAISSKHTLAITNRGGATGEQVADLARFVQTRVESELGVHLVPEPVLVSLEV